MILTTRQKDWLVREAERSHPREACGVLVGSGADATVTEIFRAVNLDAAPERRYLLDPRLLARLARKLRGRAERVLGFYHSHPSGSVEASSLDRIEAWPGTLYLVIDVREGRCRAMRCWVRETGAERFREEEVRIVGD